MASHRSRLSLDIPKLNYKEAIEYLRDQNCQIALVNTLPDPLQPRAVDVCVFDPQAMTLCVFNAGQLVITPETTVKTLVLQLQTLLDSVNSEQDSLMHSTGQLLVCEIDIRVGGNLMTASLPAIKGVPSFAQEHIGMFLLIALDLVLAMSREADCLPHRLHHRSQTRRSLLGAR
jgi:hypothetical protein